MIKYLMRKTIYKKYDIESQDMLFQLTLNRHLLEILCLSFWVFIYIFSFIPVIIIVISEKIEFSILTNITLIIYFLLYFMGYILLLIVFPRAMFSFTHLLAQKLFFLIYTKKGKAITKKDFSKIKHIKEELYLFIETQMCKGYCYSICFEICKVLKKGYIEFLAIRDIRICGEDEDDEKDFTMHVLFHD